MVQRRTSPPLCFIGWICPLDSLRWRVLVWPSAARPLVSRQAHARISKWVFGPYFTGLSVQQKGHSGERPWVQLYGRCNSILGMVCQSVLPLFGLLQRADDGNDEFFGIAVFLDGNIIAAEGKCMIFVKAIDNRVLGVLEIC